MVDKHSAKQSMRVPSTAPTCLSWRAPRDSPLTSTSTGIYKPPMESMSSCGTSQPLSGLARDSMRVRLSSSFQSGTSFVTTKNTRVRPWWVNGSTTIQEAPSSYSPLGWARPSWLQRRSGESQTNTQDSRSSCLPTPMPCSGNSRRRFGRSYARRKAPSSHMEKKSLVGTS